MPQELIVFAATFAQVFFIAMQTVAINLRSMHGAAASATCIAGLNIFVLSRVVSTTASGGEMIAYIIANTVAVPIAMWIGFRFSKTTISQ